ncbi:hypothetical protein A3770_07p49140 [Chloropicon primus]|uniref:DUF1997 domain-containing protein n=1 Tax=Chloropicon primus TaxID=1764295 RepID=A0A5B8MPJ3_9CHLO|nr:hypothetical protein A3770_07p49140 [Chloropicon primus]|eukprot:QDZ22396.1 hypothetical protein A3770_07p49140 [Chloropicon primus]
MRLLGRGLGGGGRLGHRGRSRPRQGKAIGANTGRTLRHRAGDDRPSTLCEALYTSARDTEFTMVELNSGRTVDAYLQQVDRIVYATFPDESRRRLLEEGKWEVTLLEQDFFGVKFAPRAVLRVWNEGGQLGIQVSDIDLSDLPDEIRVPAELKVDGRLRSSKRTPASKVNKLRGMVKMSLGVEVPFPYSTFPLLRETVEAILGGVISRLEESLKRSLPQDFAKWARSKEKAESKVLKM